MNEMAVDALSTALYIAREAGPGIECGHTAQTPPDRK